MMLENPMMAVIIIGILLLVNILGNCFVILSLREIWRELVEHRKDDFEQVKRKSKEISDLHNKIHKLQAKL